MNRAIPQADTTATGNLQIFGFDCPAWCAGSIPVMAFGLLGAWMGWGL
ncbi:MAG TPA: hypothetical protein VF637_13430 [Sphingomicrobium sp.]|jgi:hypothetical protein